MNLLNSCQTNSSFQEASVKILVKFKPIVKIKQVTTSENTDHMLKEGKKLVLSCEANGNPSNFQFNWLLDGQKVNGEFNIQNEFSIPILTGDVVSWSVKENIFIIPAVTRELRGRKISCEVSNSVGSSKDQIQLNIACKNKYIYIFQNNYSSDGPQDISVSGRKTGLMGEQVSLFCLTDSNPSQENKYKYKQGQNTR